MIEGLVAVEMEETPTIGMIIKIGVPAPVKDSETFITIKGVDKTTHIEANKDSGMAMTLIIVTETIGIEIPTVKVILTGVEDGIIIVEVKDIMIEGEGEDGIPINNIMIQGINKNPNLQIQIIIVHHLWDISTDTQSHMSSTHTPNHHNNINHKCRQLHLSKLQIFCQLCNSQGHYDYQCQFAGDFIARTQKAFNQGRSYSHQDPNHGEWSHGDNDNNDPNGQPFQ